MFEEKMVSQKKQSSVELFL
jgi:hypothetical protein